MPLLHPERFVQLGIDPPKGVLLYGPPGTGKTLVARAVANRTDACFIRVIGSELVQRYVGEGARMVRELFQMARNKKSCIIFFDEIDSIMGARGGNEHEASRRLKTEFLVQFDGVNGAVQSADKNLLVLAATNRPGDLDEADSEITKNIVNVLKLVIDESGRGMINDEVIKTVLLPSLIQIDG